MKLLFISKIFNLEQLGIMQLSAILKNEDFDCELIVPELESDFMNKIKELNPYVIMYSTTTGLHKYYLDLNLSLKSEFDFISVFGGSHPTFFPEMIEEIGVDIICRGEGEEAIIELMQKLKESKDISNIKNLWIKKSTKIYKNGLRPLIQDLDSIPYPDRSLTSKYKYYRNKKSKTFITSRGCVYDCTYCFNHGYKRLYQDKGQYVRRRTPKNVVDEINQVRKQFRLKQIIFQDDIFILDKKWISEFCELYKKEIGLPFFCQVRINLVNDEVIKLLKIAGCYGVDLAIESGDNQIRNEILNRRMTEKQIINACKIIRDNKLMFISQNMLGLPTENLEKAFKTLKLNIKCKPTYAWASLFQPYCGTTLGDYCKSKNLIEKEISSYYFNSSPLLLKDKKEIENLHRFFDIAVQYPFLLPLIKLLIKFPKNSLYDLIFKINGFIRGLKLKFVEISPYLLRIYKITHKD